MAQSRPGRSKATPRRLTAALKAVSATLAEFPNAAMVIGGVAVIVRGVPRVTRDIDITIAPGRLKPRQIMEKTSAHGILPRIPNAVEFAEKNQVLLLRHEASEVDIDLSLAWLLPR